MDNAPVPLEEQHDPEDQMPLPIAERDPYPKMIIVCIFISLSLFFIIVMVLMFELVSRDMREEIRPSNPAFFEEHLENPPPLRSN